MELASTRRSIMDLVRRSDSVTASELAAALGITPSAVRQHLAALAAAEFVVAEREPRGLGRPALRYRIGAQGEQFFPKRYDSLSLELLDDLEHEDPGLVDRFFARRRRRRIEAARGRLRGRTLAERVEELARILDEDGYLATSESLPDGSFRIVEHNCAVLEVARRYGQACSSEIEFIRRVLPDARVARVTHMASGASSCGYEIRPKDQTHS